MKPSGELFARATQRVGEIRDIVWVNPERMEEEEPIDLAPKRCTDGRSS